MVSFLEGLHCTGMWILLLFSDSHSWLLGSDIDILPFLLLPLAGPEELSEEEMEGLPEDLQYLGDDKKREDDPDIRKMLIESIMQVCVCVTHRQWKRGGMISLKF